MSEASNNLTTLRDALFAQLKELRGASGGAALAEAIDKSKAVSQLGQVLIESAKVEVEYLRVNKGGESGFLDTTIGNEQLPQGITGITRHRLGR